MVRPVHLLTLPLALAASTLAAQPPPILAAPAAVTPGAGTTTATAADADNAAPSSSRKSLPPAVHTMSPEVSAQLAASRPKFSPLPPPPPPKPESELADLRETDKPKNTIVRLPKFVVQEPRPPVFTERTFARTTKDLAQVAMRRYMTDADRAMNRFTLPLFSVSHTPGLSANEDRALAMYYEDERLKNMADIADNTNMVMKSDAAAGAKMQNTSRDMFMHWQDFGYNPEKK